MVAARKTETFRFEFKLETEKRTNERISTNVDKRTQSDENSNRSKSCYSCSLSYSVYDFELFNEGKKKYTSGNLVAPHGSTEERTGEKKNRFSFVKANDKHNVTETDCVCVLAS